MMIISCFWSSKPTSLTNKSPKPSWLETRRVVAKCSRSPNCSLPSPCPLSFRTHLLIPPCHPACLPPCSTHLILIRSSPHVTAVSSSPGRRSPRLCLLSKRTHTHWSGRFNSQSDTKACSLGHIMWWSSSALPSRKELLFTHRALTTRRPFWVSQEHSKKKQNF